MSEGKIERKIFLLSGLVTLGAVYFLDRLANRYFLYWRFIWFDMLVHFLTGLALALLAYFVLIFRAELSDGKKVKIIFWLTLLGSLAWEGFELLILHRVEKLSLIDTSSDVLFGLLGSLAGVGIYYLLICLRASLESNQDRNNV